MATASTLCLFMVFLLVGSCLSYTFSTKLIHRLSHEMKSPRVCRKGELSDSWPRSKSMDYYQLLVSSDLQRQKMKLGPRHQLLFPSQGSKVMSFGNDFGWLHYTWIDIGTPNVSFLVALDAGSDLLWVPCDCIQCASLSASSYGSLDRDLSEYSPSGSSTSKHLACSHELCERGPNCKTPKQPCPYIANYFSENTSSSGLLIEDILHLSSSSDHASRDWVQASVIIGCGRKQSGSYLDGVAPDGLMGLGPGDISVLSILSKKGLVRNSFSMCFGEDDSGRLFFGDQGAASQQFTSFLPLDGKYVTYIVGVEGCCVGTSCLEKSGFRAQVDSGTSFTFLPDEVYEKLAVQFDRRVNATRSNFEGSPWDYCYEASSKDLLKIPTVTFKFSVNNSFIVHDPAVLIYDNQDLIGFCLAIQPVEEDLGTIGQNYMTGYRLVFDRENMRLGWSRSNCQDLSDDKSMQLTPPPRNRSQNPLPTNEQQSTPNGRAVAPAVAVRAPTEPSSAPPHLIASQFSSLRLLARFVLILLSFFVVSI